MTGDAADRLEQLIAVLLLRRERPCIATEPKVEPAPGGQQRPFIGCNRIQEARTVRSMPIGFAELLLYISISTELSEDLPDAFSHDSLILQRGLGLCLECTKTALPVEAKAERRVEDCARIERKLCSIDRLILPIGARSIGAYIVARDTRARPAVGPAGSRKEAFPEVQLQGVGGRRQRHRRYRLFTGRGLWAGGLSPTCLSRCHEDQQHHKTPSH